MIVTGKFPHGNCEHVRRESGEVISAGVHLHPEAYETGLTNQCPLFHARIEEANERAFTLRVRWPPFDPDSARTGVEYGGNHSFAEVAADAVYSSTDGRNWRRVSSAERRGWNIEIPVRANSDPFYVAVNLPYTMDNLRSLRRELAPTEVATEYSVGASYGGMDIPAFRVTDPSTPTRRKRTVYMQAGQHPSELTGPRVIDAMLRFLTGAADPSETDATQDDAEATSSRTHVRPSMAEASEDLRRRFLEEIVLHAVPIVAMDAWYEGLDYHLSGTNLNRDWQNRSQPETRALVANLDKLSAEGEQPVLALDLHNGWHSREHDGSAMTVWPVDAVGPETVQRQHRLIERIAEHCDYIPADAVWSNGFSPDRFAAQMWKRYGAQAHTMEFSRFSIWERQQGRVPLTQQRIEHLGRDLAKAILEWLSEEGSG